jgi:hypothetical protein
MAPREQQDAPAPADVHVNGTSTHAAIPAQAPAARAHA